MDIESQLSAAYEDYRLRQYRKAVERFRTLVEDNPNNVTARQGLAESLAALSCYKDAIAECQRAWELDPESVIIPQILGYIYLRQRRYQSAEKELSKVIALDPKRSRPYVHLGTLRLEQGRHDEAIQILRKAIALNPDEIVAHINLGVAYNQQQGYGEAYKEFKEAFTRVPSFEAGWGMIVAFVGRYRLLASLLFLFCLLVPFVAPPTLITLPLVAIPLGFALLDGVVLFRSRDSNSRKRGIALLVCVGMTAAAYVYHLCCGI